MHRNLQRAFALLHQERLDLAEKELRNCLAEEPNNPVAHATLALCLARAERLDEATAEAQQAIVHAPDISYSHYAMSRVLIARNRFAEAEAAIREAIALEPQDAACRATLAEVCFNQRRWQDALEAAEAGLAVDPEDASCTNLRAMALVKLGRRVQAGEAIESALARNPEDATSHANLGWTLIEQGNHRRAMEHFREALRLDPELDWARHGIVEALKARNFIYRAVLRYFLWMARLSGRAQWGVLVGGYMGYQVLKSVARSSPALQPFIVPVLVAYVVFAILTWLAYPMFNLALRLHPFGRYALSRRQTVQANWVGAWLAATLVFASLYFAGLGWAPVATAVLFGLTLPALASIFACDAGWPRQWMIGVTAALFLCGTLIVIPMWIGDWLSPAGQEVALAMMQFFAPIFFFGALASQFAANYLASAKVRR